MITYTTAVSGIAGRSVPIASGGDFVVRLAPPKQPLDGSTIDKNLPLAIDFRVSRDVMVAHSDAVRELLRLRPHMSCIAVENNSSYGISYAVEIWLWSIHGNYEDLPPSLKAFHYVRVWNVIAIGQRLGFSQHMHALKPWFLAIYRQTLDTEPGLTLTVARTLTWPCTVFDHAEGFMKLTKYLVYNTNTSLLMHNPSMYHELTNEARLLNGPLVEARSHVHSIIERELQFPLDRLHHADCVCRKETAFDYENALMKIGCWPIASAAKRHTISELVKKLSLFDHAPTATTCESGVCRHDFKKCVELAIARANDAFEGLCLDCMQRSTLVTGQDIEKFAEKTTPYKFF